MLAMGNILSGVTGFPFPASAVAAEHFFRCDRRVAVNGHGIFRVLCVPTA